MQNDFELKQSLFEWVAYLEQQRQQPKEGKRAKSEVEKEQDKAKKAGVNLLQTWSQRELSTVTARTQKLKRCHLRNEPVMANHEIVLYCIVFAARTEP